MCAAPQTTCVRRTRALPDHILPHITDIAIRMPAAPKPSHSCDVDTRCNVSPRRASCVDAATGRRAWGEELCHRNKDLGRHPFGIAFGGYPVP
jgi:hypothetical protein